MVDCCTCSIEWRNYKQPAWPWRTSFKLFWTFLDPIPRKSNVYSLRYADRRIENRMLIIIFTTRCYVVRPSVRPSVTRRYSVETAKRVIRLLSRIIPVFSISNGMAIFRQGPPNGGVECRGMKKIAIFGQYLTPSRKWCKTELGLHLQWPTNCKSYMISNEHFQWPWMTPKPDLTITKFFDAKYLRND